MSNVTTLPGIRPPITGKPNEALIAMLEGMLNHARSGYMQSLVATGFMSDGHNFTSTADTHENVYEMYGAIVVLQVQYQHRHPDAFK